MTPNEECDFNFDILISKLFNGILRVSFEPCLLFTLLFQRLQTLMGIHLPKWFHLGMFRTHFLTFSHTCGSVFEYWDTLPTHIYSHAPTFVVSSKLMSWQFGRPFCYHCGPFPSCVAIFVNLFKLFSIAW